MKFSKKIVFCAFHTLNFKLQLNDKILILKDIKRKLFLSKKKKTRGYTLTKQFLEIKFSFDFKFDVGLSAQRNN